MTQLGVWPESFQPPPIGAVPPTIFADMKGFDVRVTLKGPDGNVIATNQMRTKRNSGECCGPYWTARL